MTWGNWRAEWFGNIRGDVLAGCAMIGQSGINVRSGGRGRLSTFVAGAFLLVLVVGLEDIVGRLRRTGAVVRMIGLNEASASMIERLGARDKIEPQQAPSQP